MNLTGHIFWVDMKLVPGTSDVKDRPCIVVHDDDGDDIVTILSISSVGFDIPPSMSDMFKFELQHWNQTRLYKPSFVICDPFLKAHRDDLYDHAGPMEITDWNGMMDLIQIIHG
jgi:hypothetical protein